MRRSVQCNAGLQANKRFTAEATSPRCDTSSWSLSESRELATVTDISSAFPRRGDQLIIHTRSTTRIPMATAAGLPF